MENFFFLIYPLIFALIFIGAQLNKKRLLKTEASWANFAGLHGLNFRDIGFPDMEIRGLFQGHEIHLTIRIEVRGEGRNEVVHHFTTASVQLHDETLRATLAIRRRHPPASFAKSASSRERFLAIFEPIIDSAGFTSLLNDDQALHAILTLNDQAEQFLISDGQLLVERPALMKTTDELSQFLSQAVDVVQRIEDAATFGQSVLLDEDHEHAVASNGVSW